MPALNTQSPVSSSDKSAGVGSGILVTIFRAFLFVLALGLLALGLWLRR